MGEPIGPDEITPWIVDIYDEEGRWCGRKHVANLHSYYLAHDAIIPFVSLALASPEYKPGSVSNTDTSGQVI